MSNERTNDTVETNPFDEIIAEINTNFPDNSQQLITAEKLRDTLTDLTDVINDVTDEQTETITTAISDFENEMEAPLSLADEIDVVTASGDADLYFADTSGNTIAYIHDGHIETKNFDSEDALTINTLDVNIGTTTATTAVLEITDASGNVVVRFTDGHIKTKSFDSSDINIDGLLGKQWDGKKWWGFGTSMTNISNEGKYPIYLSHLSGLEFTNGGISGGGYTTTGGANAQVYDSIMAKTSSDFEGYDLITVEFGVNDYLAPIGDITDGLNGSAVTGNTTLCAALNLVIRHLQANSDAQIVIIESPLRRKANSAGYPAGTANEIYYGNKTFGSDNHTVEQMNEAIEKVCLLNSVYCIKAANNLGYAKLNSSNNYNVDHVHHTNLGGYVFATGIWRELETIPLFYTSIPS